MAGALDRIERITARDPRAGRADRVGLLDDIFVSRHALFVREDDVFVHLLVRDGAIEAVEGAEARDEQDHLGPIRAFAAADRKTPAGGSAKRPFLETHGPRTILGGRIKVPGDWPRL